MANEPQITLRPIGYIRTQAEKVPRHWSVSDIEGILEINTEFADGLRDIEEGQKIVVLFHFHKSPEFNAGYLFQTPPNRSSSKGVFSICSPIRPNPIGMSVVEVMGKDGRNIRVKHIDMMDGTPILDIKPLVTGQQDCPSSGA